MFRRSLVAAFVATVTLLAGAPFAGTAQAADPAPPAFSRPVASSFPGDPNFVTCLQGQFNPPPNTGPSTSQYWYLRAEGSGGSGVTVYAVSVNSSESGAITGRLYNGAALVGSVTVFMPPTAGSEAVGTIFFSATAGTIYRLEVIREAPTTTSAVAHHYKLGFIGVPFTVGLNSPTFQAFEGNTQYFHVNAKAGEVISLGFDNSVDPGGLSTGSVEVRDPANNLVAIHPSGPFPYLVPFVALTGGTYTVIANVDHHWTMSNTGGSDTGIYMDKCPPPPPPPGDRDSDGVPDGNDNCPDTPNGQRDSDHDGAGDECDPDLDGDGALNEFDNCKFDPNPDQADFDKDGRGDRCDPDFDGDGIDNQVDNCPDRPNPDQRDTDGDDAGDVCDPVNDLDRDNDGVPNDGSDNCPDNPNSGQFDRDRDGIGDACDPVDDDIDRDGVRNEVDNCPNNPNPGQGDIDGDGIGDACDPDSDNDGVADSDDTLPLDPNVGDVELTAAGVGALIDQWVSNKGAANALGNHLENAETEFAKGHLDHAAKKLEDFLKRLADEERKGRISASHAASLRALLAAAVAAAA